MPIKEFWCLEGKHYFEEHDSRGGKRNYFNAICRDCTKRIMEKFFTSSDDVRISRIYENIVDPRAVKRRWWKRRKKDGKEEAEVPEAAIHGAAKEKHGRAAGKPDADRSQQTKGVPKKDGTAWASSARPEGRLPNASEGRGSAGGAHLPGDGSRCEEAETAAVATDGRPAD